MATLKQRVHRYNGSSYDTVHYETSSDLVLHGSSTVATELNNSIRFRGIDPISSTSEDTKDTWANLGPGYWYITQNITNNQPFQWGTLMSYTYGGEVKQTFYANDDNGYWIRWGNDGTGMHPWTQVYPVNVSGDTATLNLINYISYRIAKNPDYSTLNNTFMTTSVDMSHLTHKTYNSQNYIDCVVGDYMIFTHTFNPSIIDVDANGIALYYPYATYFNASPNMNGSIAEVNLSSSMSAKHPINCTISNISTTLDSNYVTITVTSTKYNTYFVSPVITVSLNSNYSNYYILSETFTISYKATVSEVTTVSRYGKKYENPSNPTSGYVNGIVGSYY